MHHPLPRLPPAWQWMPRQTVAILEALRLSWLEKPRALYSHHLLLLARKARESHGSCQLRGRTEADADPSVPLRQCLTRLWRALLHYRAYSVEAMEMLREARRTPSDRSAPAKLLVELDRVHHADAAHLTKGYGLRSLQTPRAETI